MMKNFTPDKKGLYLQQIVAVFLFVAAIIIVIISSVLLQMLFLLWYIIPLFIVIYVYIAVYYLNKLFKSIKYTINDDKITTEKGLFIIKRRTLMKNKIIFSKLTYSPLAYFFNLKNIVYIAPGVKVKLKYVDGTLNYK